MKELHMKNTNENNLDGMISNEMSNLVNMWKMRDSNYFDFCKQLYSFHEKHKAEKKHLKKLYKELNIKRRFAEKLIRVGKVFNKYEYAHVSAYPISNLIRLAALDNVGLKLVENKKMLTCKELDIAIKKFQPTLSESYCNQNEDDERSDESSNFQEIMVDITLSDVLQSQKIRDQNRSVASDGKTPKTIKIKKTKNVKSDSNENPEFESYINKDIYLIRLLANSRNQMTKIISLLNKGEATLKLIYGYSVENKLSKMYLSQNYEDFNKLSALLTQIKDFSNSTCNLKETNFYLFKSEDLEYSARNDSPPHPYS